MKSKLFFVLVIGMFLISSVFATEYQLKKSSELVVGDVIVASDGSEIVVDKIEGKGRVQETFEYGESKSLMDVVWGKIAGENLPEPVVSGGSSSQGLSLGEIGTGVRVSGDVVAEFSLPKEEKKKSFWDKLMFWRENE